MNDSPSRADLFSMIFSPDDVVELRAFGDDRKGGVGVTMLASKLDTRGAAWIVERAREELNIYFGANPRIPDRVSGGAGCCTAADVALARVVFVDIDGGVAMAEAHRRIRDAGIVPPTATVESGGGIHCYWRLDAPCDDLSLWSRTQRALIAALDADTKPKDAPRVMRCPDTLNRKRHARCRVAELHADRVYGIDDLGVEPVADVPKPEPAATRGPRATDPNIIERARLYLARTDPAVAGQRGHDMTFRVASVLVHGFMLPDDDALSLLGEYNSRCVPPWDDHELRHKIKSARDAGPPAGKVEGWLLGDVLLATPGADQVDIGGFVMGGDAPKPTTKNTKPTPKAMKQGDPIIVELDEVEACDVRWLWHGRIPSGRMTLISGRPGGGKSMISLDLAARVSRGRDWPDGSPCEQGGVLLICAEDDPADTVKPRLEAARADMTRVRMLTGVSTVNGKGEPVQACFDLSDTDALRQAMATTPELRLVVVDPIGSYIGGDTNGNLDNAVRAVLAPAAALAAEFDAALVVVAHTRKAFAEYADDTVMGSRAFTGLARAVHHVLTDRNDATEMTKYLLPGKCNLAKRPAGLVFNIDGDPPQIIWMGATDLTADDVLRSEQGGDGGEGSGERAERLPGGEATEEAAEFLRDELADGPRLTTDLETEAKAAGLSWATVKRARKLAGVRVRKQPRIAKSAWWWMLVEADPPDWWREGKNPPDEPEIEDANPTP